MHRFPIKSRICAPKQVRTGVRVNMKKKGLGECMMDMKWDAVKNAVRERLLSSEWRDLEQIVKVGVAADIWRTWYIDLSDTLQDAIIPVTYPLLQALGVSLHDLEAAAKNYNEGYTLQSMGEILGFGRTTDIPMCVISNRDCRYGAAGVLNSKVQQQLGEIFPAGTYILPSSIHEVIAVPSENADPKDLACIVRDINRSQVPENERLSDHVFQLKDGQLCAA